MRSDVYVYCFNVVHARARALPPARQPAAKQETINIFGIIREKIERSSVVVARVVVILSK